MHFFKSVVLSGNICKSIKNPNRFFKPIRVSALSLTKKLNLTCYRLPPTYITEIIGSYEIGGFLALIGGILTCSKNNLILSPKSYFVKSLFLLPYQVILFFPFPMHPYRRISKPIPEPLKTLGRV